MTILGNNRSFDAFEFINKNENFEEYVLKSNGLKVLLYQNSNMPVASVMITYKVGSINEKTGLTGATHILEHMMFKGTSNFPMEKELDYSSQMEKVGARSNATTSFDRTNYYATLPSNNVPLAIELEADRMRNLKIREEELSSEMIVVKNEYERRENSPYSSLQKEIFANAYTKHPYKNPIIGHLKDIESINVEKLKSFYDQYYWPNNAVISIIGGFNKQDTLDAIENYFGSIPKSPNPILENKIIEPIQTESRFSKVYRGGNIGAVMIAYKVPEGLHDDWASLHLLTEILGADKIGILYKLLDDKGLATASYIYPVQLKDPGLLFLGATLTANTSHDEIEEILLSALNEIKENGVTDEELDRAKVHFETESIYGRDGPFNIADSVNDAIALGDWEYYIKLPKQIKEVTKYDIQRVAKKYFSKKGQNIGWYIPKNNTNNTNGLIPEVSSKIKESLKKPFYFREPFSKVDFWENDFKSEINFTPRIKEANISSIEIATIDLDIENVISCSGSIAVGSNDSPIQSPMVAELTSTMLDKGTSTMDRFEIAELMDSKGIELNFQTTKNTLNFTGKFLKKDTETFIKILSDLLRNPKFDLEVFENFKKQYESYLLELETNTDTIAKNHLSRKLYSSNHPNYSKDISELRQSLKSTEIADIKKFHKDYYGKNSMKLVFAGDIDFPKIKKYVRNYLSSWKAAKNESNKSDDNLKSDQAEHNIFIPDKTSVTLMMGTRTLLKRSDPDYIPFSVANYILGGNFNSRLMRSIRQDKGLTYSIYTYHDDDIITSGHWALSATFSPTLLNKGIKEINEELKLWHQNGVSENEVSSAIETIKGKYIVGLSQTNSVASQVHSFMLRGFSPTYVDIYPKLLKRVNSNQVNQSIKDYLRPNTISTISAGTLIG